MATDPSSVTLKLVPVPRRSRHPYQWACALLLFVYAVGNLIIGPAEGSPLLHIDDVHQLDYLNWILALGSSALLLATVIPDNYWRMFIELGGQVLLAFTSGMFAMVSWASLSSQLGTTVDHRGIPLNLPCAVGIVIAATWRSVELAVTIRRKFFRPAAPSIDIERRAFEQT